MKIAAPSALAASAGRFESLSYLPSFSIGALAFRYQDRLKPYFANLPALIICFLGAQFFRRLSPAWRFETNYVAFVPTLAESIFAAGIVLSIAARPVSYLRTHSLIRLGDISYSLYLIHFILMSALAKALGTINAPSDGLAAALMASTLVSAILASRVSYSLIEIPGIALGKKAIGAINRTTGL